MVFGSTRNLPFFLDCPQMCVNPRKSNVSGLPSLRCFRLATAKRPNSIRRVLSGCNSNPNSILSSLGQQCPRDAVAHLLWEDRLSWKVALDKIVRWILQTQRLSGLPSEKVSRKIFTVDKRDFSVYRIHGRIRPSVVS